MLISVDGPAPLERVWECYTSPARWPDWAPQIRRVDATADPIAPDVRGTVHGPLLVRVPFRVLEVDDDERRWSWRVGFGPVGLRMTHGVDPSAAGSRAWVEIHAPSPLVLPYVPLARHALRRLVA